MSIRAVLLGLLGAALLAGIAFINDDVWQLNRVIGNHMPFSVFGALILFVVALNPLLGRISRRLRFKPMELAVAMAITLTSCGVPSSGFFRFFGATVIHPSYWNEITPGWQKIGLMNYAPKKMMPNEGVFDDDIHGGFREGMRKGDENISLSQVPWHAWKGPLLKFWLPMAACLMIGMIGLTLVVHEQWSRYEKMPYPIAEVATSIIEPGPGGTIGPLFRNKAFWYAGAAVLAVHVINIVHSYYPNSTIMIPLQANLSPLLKKATYLDNGMSRWALTFPKLFVTGVAFAFFMRTDAAFSVAIAPLAWTVMTATMYRYDVVAHGGYFVGAVKYVHFFAYLAMGVLLLYTGRHFYSNVLRRTFFFPARAEVPRRCVWGFRVFLVTMVCAGMLLYWAGLDWPFAIMFLVGLVVIYVISTRMSVEMGLFFISAAGISISVVVFGLFGAKAMGAKAILAMGIPFLVFGFFLREHIMPFAANAFRVCDRIAEKTGFLADHKPVTGRLAWWFSVAVLISLAVATPVVIWAHYNWGSSGYEPSTSACNAQGLFDGLQGEVDKLAIAGDAQKSADYTLWERFANMKISRELLWVSAFSIGLVLLCGFMRLRYLWWPLHPVLFLVWGSSTAGVMWGSFLVGVIIKTAVGHIWGMEKIIKIRPLLIGLIAGDLIGGLVNMVANVGYYFAMGNVLLSPYRIFPI